MTEGSEVEQGFSQSNQLTPLDKKGLYIYIYAYIFVCVWCFSLYSVNNKMCPVFKR